MTSRNLYTEQRSTVKNVKGYGRAGAFLLAFMLLFGVQAMAQYYVQATNFSNGSSAAYNGVTVTVTRTGTATNAVLCGTAASPYRLVNSGDSYTFTFSHPVGSVNLSTVFGNVGAGTMRVVKNGTTYTIKDANLAGTVGTCSAGVLAVATSGDLTNTGNVGSNANNQVIIPGPITTLTVSSQAAASILFGMSFTATTFYQVTAGSGASATLGGVTTTVSSAGDNVVFAPGAACGGTAQPYMLSPGGASTGTFSFSFSPAVDAVNVPVIIGLGPIITHIRLTKNGSAVTLTSADVLGNVIPNTCTPGSASIIGGDLTNSGATLTNPSANVSLNGPVTTFSVTDFSGFQAAIHGMYYSKSTTAALTFNASSNQTLSLCTSAAATDITGNLAFTDANVDNDVVFTLKVPPLHGTVVLGGPETATGGSVTPSNGAYTYQPTGGYTGTDGFTIEMTDGINTVTTTIIATMSPAADVSNFSTTAANVCMGNGAVVTMNSTTVPAGTYTVTYNVSGANTFVGQTASVTFAANTASFTTTSLPTAGATTVTITNLASSCASVAVAAGNVAGFTVNSNPSPIFTPSPNYVCEGGTITLTDGTVGGTYTSSNALLATVVGGTGVVTGVLAGTPTITYTIGATTCFVTTTVTVNSSPAAITGSHTVCTGSTTALGQTVAGGTWSSSNPIVGTVSTTGVVGGVAAGNFTITYTMPGGCFTTYTETVNQTPPAMTGTTFTVCTGSTITLADGTGGGLFSSSNSGVASVVAGTGVVSGVTAGTPTITYTVPNSCFVTQGVTVNTTPNAIAGASSVCVGFQTTLTDLTAGGTWTSSNILLGTVGAASGIVGGVAAGSPTITYTVPNGCFVTQLMAVNPNPAAIGGSPFTVCTGATTTATDATGSGTWSSSNSGLAGIVAGTGVITGVSTGNPVISYTLATGCFATQQYTVNQTPVATTGASSVCVGLTTTLTNTTGGGTWSTSNPAIATVVAGTGVVTGVAAGSVNITYTVPTGCFYSFPMTVNNNPVAIGGTFTVCAGSTTTLTDATAGGSWTSSNGAIATVGGGSGILTGVTAGNATISYTVGATGCYATQVVTVNTNPTAITGTTGICVGGTSTLATSPAGGTWSSSAPGVATVGAVTGTVTAISAGTANITYTLASGCFATTTVTVFPLPSAISGPSSVCVGSTITLTDGGGGIWTSSNPANASVGAGTGIVTGNTGGTSPTITYTLPSGCSITTVINVNSNPAAIGGTLSACVGTSSNLNDGTAGGTWTSSNSSVASVVLATGVTSGVSAGTATISYTLATGCFATASFVVNPLPAAITGVLSVCTGATTALNDATGGGTWSSSDITKASVGAATGVVSGVAAGSATITYTLATGCIQTATVVVNQTPVGITGTAAVCVGLTTTLADATPGPATWTSSNTSLATVVAGTGVVTGVAAGTPNITYTISATGCFTTLPVVVNPNPVVPSGSGAVCVGSTTLYTDATSGGTWSSSNPSLATVGASTGIVTGVLAGSPNIVYTLPTGCLNQVAIVVNPLPSAISGTATACTGFTSTLGDATLGGTWTSSSPTLASVVAGTGVVSALIAGTPVITYTLPTGCAATVVFTVNPTPPAITGTTSVCVGSTTTLANATSGGLWTSSNATFGTVGAGTGTVTGISAGTPNISYTVPTGCFVLTPVVVNPLPASISGTTNVCIGLTTTLASGTPGGTWTSSNATIASVGAGTGIVSGNTAGTVTITYTLGTTCFTTTSLTVNPNPAAITGATSVCTGFSTTFASATTGGTWTSSSSPLATIGAGTGVINGLSVGNPTMTYTLATGCLATKAIAVNQTPAAITGTTNVCIGLTTTLTSATLGGNWSSSNSSQAGVGAGTGIVTGVTAGVPVISYVMPVTGCFVTQPVTVNPNPAAITGATSVCTGLTIGLADATAGGTWTSSNATVASIIAGTGVVTGVTAGSVTITYALPTGCLATYAVAVNTTPAAITGVTNVCTGFNTSLASATIGGNWLSSNVSEATVGGVTGVVTGVTSGTPIITYQMPTGCQVTTPVTVNTNPAPISGTLSVCVGLTTSLSNTLSGGTWSSTAPAQATVGASSGIVTGVAAGNPVVSYTMATGCYALANMTVNPTPAAVTGPSVVCAGSNITLADATSGGTWSSGNTSIATVAAGTGVVTGVAAGVVNITYTLGAGCTASTPITVNAVPNITNFTSTIASSQCVGNGGTVTISSTSLGAGTFTVTYNLSGANAVTGATATLTTTATNGTFTIPSASLSATGFTTVTITAISNSLGCVSNPLSNNTSTFSIYALPTVYNVTGGGGYCVGGTGVHVFLSNSVGGINYQLWLGATAVGAPMAGTFSGLDFGLITTVGTYSVTATNITTGCNSNMFGTATIFTNPLPTTFSVTGGGSYCAGGTGVAVGLANSTAGVNYQLYIGGVASGSPVSGSGSAISFGLQTSAGVYTVVATNTSTACTSNMTGSATVVINPLPAAIAGTMTACPGTTTTLTDATVGGTWSSTTPSVATVGAATGVVTGVAAGTATISYTLPTGCAITAVVTVNPNPAAIAGLTSVCVGSATTLTDATGGGTWGSSNTSLATVNVVSGIVVGVAAGTPTMTYTLSTGCYSVFPMTVNPTPVAITGATNVCVGQTATAVDLTSGGTWSSSTAAVGTVVAATGVVTGIASGTTTLTYTLPAGCSVTSNFTVNPIPASITGTATMCVGASSTLANSVSGGAWTSSNGLVATVISGSGFVQGISAGTSVITYTLPAGCFTTTIVTINPIPSAIGGVNNVCVGLTTTLTNTVAGGTWTSSGGAATIGAATGVVTGVSAGSVTITYTLPAGCFTTFGFTVNPIPAAITGVANVCIGSTTTLANASVGGTWTSSNTSLGTVGAATGIVGGIAAGTPIITYTLPTTCFITAPVTVNPLPVAITGIGTVCQGATTTLFDASAGGTWTSSSSALATVGSATGVVGGVTPGNPVITYTLPTGCITTTVVTVYPAPAAIVGSNTVCVGFTATLTNAVSGGTWSSSNIALATVGSGTGVVSGLAVGVPTISYTLPAPGSCATTMNVSVNPQPVAITGTFTVCQGAVTNLSDATTGGTWSASNANVSVNSLTGIVTGVTAGTSVITYTLPAGCFVTQSVTIFPTPVAITGTPTVCVGLTTALADASTGGTWTISGASASINSVSGLVTGISAGTPVVTYTLPPGGCTTVYPITVNPLPAAITGTTSVCIGSSTTLSDASPSGSWSSSNPSIATIGGFTGVATGVSAGTIVYTYTLPTGCIATTNGTVNALPNVYTLTGGGTYCAGGTGATVGLSGSDVGINYQLMNGAATVGSPVAGTGSPISFGLLTTAATYTVVATNTTTSCVNSMAGSATVAVTVLPTVFNMTGGGAYCAGGTGVAVGLTSSTSTISYQLYLNGAPLGTPIVSGGGILSFGLMTGAGNYTVIATNPATSCVNNMAGVSAVVINPLPTAFTVTGGGINCPGSTGVSVGLSGSQVGVNYTLSGLGTVLPGTGSPLNFGLITTNATYTVSALNTVTGCTSTMTSSAVVAAGTLPTVFSQTPNIASSAYCVGGPGITVLLSNSQIGVNYQLMFGGTPTGTTLAGTNLGLNFGAQFAPGAYTIKAINATTGCNVLMSGTTTVSLNPLPNPYHITSGSGGTVCAPTGFALISVDTTLVGYTYKLYNGSSLVNTTVAAATTLTFPSVTAAGVYTVTVTAPITSCSVTVTGSATVSAGVTPTAYTLSPVGTSTSYCIGGTGIALQLNGSDLGVRYQLYQGGVPLGTPIVGTGSTLSFGTLPVGNYTVVATNISTLCTATQNPLAGLGITNFLAIPTYTVTGGGSYCAGGAGLVLGLSGSTPGVTYQLLVGGVPVPGATVLGTASAITFPAQTATGIYTVLATNLTSLCTANMTGSAIISINSAPAPLTVSGGGSYCAGGTGVPVNLSGSVVGTNYQLFRAGTALGAPVAGTGSPLSFANQTLAGAYTIGATIVATGCTATMTGSVNVTINAAPVTYNVTGGGGYCVGGTGVAIGLNGSDAGINYTLFKDGISTGISTVGTGSAISFGLQTATGLYIVSGVNSTTTCSANMTGSQIISVNPLPAVFNVTGGGSYCPGGAGKLVGLDGSATGVSYQLYLGSSPVGAAVNGTGALISFGLQTGVGTYSVRAMNISTTCTSVMTGTAVISLYALPSTYTVTGGGGYCVGGTGSAVSLSGSTLGTNYQLFRGTTSITTLAGSGAALNFGLQTGLGAYTVVATSVATSCSSNMTGTVTVSLNPLPVAYNVTGGGSYCAGGTGVVIGTSGSDATISYQLLKDLVPVGPALAGSGSALSFGLQTAAGSYTVVATNSVTSCTNNLMGSQSITINALPAVYAVGGGGNYCAGGTGRHITLSTSDAGINYQLKVGGVNVGGTVAGIGGPLDFGAQTAAGTYTVSASNGLTSCSSDMSGSVVITIDPLPSSTFYVTGGGSYCAGSTGLPIGLSGSASGISYQLYNGTVAAGLPLTGSGGSLNFGIHTDGGTYTVIATNTSTLCTNNMTGSANITVNPLPNVDTVTGGGNYCPGGVGNHIGLSSSSLGINYQLYRGLSALGTPVAGTGSGLDFGLQSVVGTYFVTAIDATTSCSINMVGSPTIGISPLPVAYSLVASATGYCLGGSGVGITLSGSESGTSYQLYLGTVPAGAPMTGTGFVLDFGLQTSAGTYSVIATNGTTTCTNNMSGTPSIVINPLPAPFTVTGGGGYCAGGAGVNINLSGSETGIDYQLKRGSASVGSALAGSGFSLAYGLVTTGGTYSVLATNSSTGCTNTMLSTASVVVNPLPTSQVVVGGGSYCDGGAGVGVGISGSDLGTNYQLYLGTAAVGSVTPGTGSAINFGNQTSPGAYTVVATNPVTSCTATISGSVSVSVNALPVAFTVTGGGNYCTGSTGVHVGVSGSAVGVSYQLKRGSTSVATLAGTGAALDFGLFTTTGTYTVEATSASTGCVATMTGSVLVSVSSLPAVYSVSGGGTYCSSTSGVAVGMLNSESGVSYQLYNGTSTVGGAVAGVGGPISFGLHTAGVYSVVATNVTTACTSNMSGIATVTVMPSVTPSVSVATGVGDTVCTGTTVTFSALPVNGGTLPTYQWSVNGVSTGTSGNSYTYIPSNGNVVSVTMTSNEACPLPATANGSVTMTVRSIVTPAVTIAANPGHTICQGTTVDVVATPVNGGATPSYSWQLNGSPVSASNTFTYIPMDGDILFVTMTSSYLCVSAATVLSNNVTFSTETNVAPVVNVVLGSGRNVGTVLYDDTLTAVVTGGTATHTYQWTVNGLPVGGNTPVLYRSTLNDLDMVACLVTDSNACGKMVGANSITVHSSNVGVAPVVTTTADIRLVPNPNKGLFTVKGTLAVAGDQEVTIEVTDVLGQVVYSSKVVAHNGNIDESVKMNSSIANGMYMVNVRSANESKVFHMVIEQ